MGLDPLTLGLTMGGLSAASTLLSGAQQSRQMQTQSKIAQANAANLREQAKAQQRTGEIAAQEVDSRKAQIRRHFEKMQGENRVQLGAGNVDLSTGSADKVALGNINLFAEDMGENAYQKAIKRWETENQVKNTNWQAANQDAMASYYSRASNNTASTLLGAGLSGASGFMSGYSWGGGKFGGLFAGDGGQKFTSNNLVWNTATPEGVYINSTGLPGVNRFVPFKK